jgi:hypothetical protein
MECWKPVVGYEGLYEVSDGGEVRGKDREIKTNIRFNKKRIIKGKILKKRVGTKGYFSVDLCKEGKVSKTNIHRIVAEAFIPNPEHKKVVNHINGNKQDNRVSNLEWVTYQENHWHARNTGLLTEIGQHNNKTILCVETGKTFKNSTKAAEWLIENESNRTNAGIKTVMGNIRRAARGITPMAYGYHWENI